MSPVRLLPPLLPLLFTLTLTATPFDYLGASTSGTSVLYSQSSPMPLNTASTFATAYLSQKPTNPKLIIAMVGY